MTQTYLFADALMDVPLDSPVNVASVPQRSPFRYPGGKTWLVPLFRRWLASKIRPPQLLIETFAGGGIIGLTAAMENLAQRVILVELDDQVAAVWETILSDGAGWLAARIQHFEMSLENLNAELLRPPESRRELAFQTILRNRTAHGGILAAGAGVLKHGENGKGVSSRWYAKTIAHRIRAIGMVTDRIQFINGDAFAVMNQYRLSHDTVFFIDPPYTAGGKRAGSRLYTHSEIDHERLFQQCGELAGDFLITYDNAPEVVALAARHGFQTKTVAMKNTHHAEMTELLIGRDLGWMDYEWVMTEEPPPYRINPPQTIKSARKRKKVASTRATTTRTNVEDQSSRKSKPKKSKPTTKAPKTRAA